MTQETGAVSYTHLDSLIAANMGDKDVSAVSPATSVEDKNAMFPVENESWSSKLTADDVESKEVVDNGSSYVCLLYTSCLSARDDLSE